MRAVTSHLIEVEELGAGVVLLQAHPLPPQPHLTSPPPFLPSSRYAVFIAIISVIMIAMIRYYLH